MNSNPNIPPQPQNGYQSPFQQPQQAANRNTAPQPQMQPQSVNTAPRPQMQPQSVNTAPQPQMQPQSVNTAPQPQMRPQSANVPPQPQPQMYMGPGQYTPYNNAKIEEQKKRSALFEALFLPTLLYALLYTFFLYKNFSSFTMPLFVIATAVYCFYWMKKIGIKRKAGSYFYLIIMLLLAISSAATGSVPLIVINTIGIFLLLVCMLLHNYQNDSKWNFGKYFVSIFKAVFGAVGCIGDPFCDASSYQKNNKNKRHTQGLYILIGVGGAIPLLIVVVSLLYFADAVFAQFIRDLLEMLNLATIIGILFTFLFAWFSAYCGLRYLGKKRITDECKDYRNAEPIIAITILSMISVVYLFFSVIQILYLFWGKMQLPEHYTYAAYAREGFFQLLFVCIINVLLVLLMRSFFRKNIALNILLAIISCCTYIMLASSAFRMILYVENYNLTFLRIMVLWGLALIAVLLVGILIQIFWEAFPLFKYGLVVVCICYLGLSFSHPDYWIAKYNLAQMENMSAKNMDYEYLEQLSSDAAPVIAKYEGSWVDAYVYHLAGDTDGSIRQFNISHAYARSLFKEEIAKKENSFYIQLRNESEKRISDVVCNFKQGDTAICSVKVSPIGEQKFEGYIPYEKFSDFEKFETITYNFTFTDNKGNVIESGSSLLTPKTGENYMVTLYGGHDYDGDGIGEYSIRQYRY